MDIKQIALKVAEEQFPHLPEEVMDYAEALVAEIQLQSEPVAFMSTRNGFICKENKNPEYNTPLFTFPPSTEALEDKVAEACADMCLALVRKEKAHAAGYGPGYLNYTAQDVADMISSGEWKKFRKGE